MTELNAKDFPGPLSAIRKAMEGKLPVRISIGGSGYTITPENQNAFHLGAMFASEEAWDGLKEDWDERLLGESETNNP